jgi:putative ABC transport system substrate-binding protein
MHRRAFLGGIASALLAGPPVAEAQQAGKVPRVGIIAINPRSAPFFVAFEQRLRELGWVEGKNLEIVFRMPRRPQDAPAAAAELVRQKVDAAPAMRFSRRARARAASSTLAPRPTLMK